MQADVGVVVDRRVADIVRGAVVNADQAAAIAAGIRLRAYTFDRYKTKKKDGEETALRASVSIAVDDVAAARKAFAPNAHLVDGVITVGNAPGGGAEFRFTVPAGTPIA